MKDWNRIFRVIAISTRLCCSVDGVRCNGKFHATVALTRKTSAYETKFRRAIQRVSFASRQASFEGVHFEDGINEMQVNSSVCHSYSSLLTETGER